MSGPLDGEQKALHPRTDGTITDDWGASVLMFGTVEFLQFWNALDGQFDSPMGRKLIYAATDSEERFLNDTTFARRKGFFWKKKAVRQFEERWRNMGWGSWSRFHIVQPCHDALAVGLSLAHDEFLESRRAEVNWRQSSSEMLDLEFSSKNSQVSELGSVDQLDWGVLPDDSSLLSGMDLDLEPRSFGYFFGQERVFFLPVGVVHALFISLRGRPCQPLNGNAYEVELPDSVLFCATASAMASAFSHSQHAVYLQGSSDWQGHLEQRFESRGFGKVSVQSSILDGDVSSVFLVRSHVPSLACGLLIAMWERAHGERARVHVSKSENELVLTLNKPMVDYATES